MVFIATIISLESDMGDMPDNIHADGEISIAFWSFVFVLLLIVTVWFYITQIAPMRRSVRQVEEEVDKEEEVAKRILEHLSNDLRFKNEKSSEERLENTSPVRVTKIEDSSVYEYVDDEIHIHYSQYTWDDDTCNTTDFPGATGAARRHSMENMDLIFPGVLPSIVEEEEFDEETDTDVSEKSQETDFDGNQYGGDFTNFPTIYKPNGNNNVESIKSLLNKEQNHLEKDTNIVISLDNPDLRANNSDTKEDRVLNDLNDDEHAKRSHSLYASVEENDVLDIKSSFETVKVEQNYTFSFSCQTNSITQEEDTEKYKISSSTEPRHTNKEVESVMAKVDFTSGSVDTSPDKDNCSKIIPRKSHDDVIEQASMFTLSSCDLKPSFKQDANEIEEHEVKLCTSSMQKITRASENGVDQHSTRDFRLKHATIPEPLVHNNISEEVNNAAMEDTRGLTGTDEDTNKTQVGEFLLHGFGDDIADSNGHTTHAWTFFSMSGGDEAAAPEKANLKEDLQSDKKEIPSIIVDSYDEGLSSDKSIVDVDSMAAMNGHDINTQHGDSFETDIDIDDIDLIDDDNLDDEGDFSIYFKRHVSVTDLDKILSEEGQDVVNCDTGRVLETNLSLEDLHGERTETDIPRTSNEVLQNTEMDTATDTTFISDEMDMHNQKSVIVSTSLSDSSEMQASDEDLDDTDSSDNFLPKTYTVESFFDDVSFQKDGVYGELVLSQLNENHGNKQNESSFDPHGDDWYGFSEEIRRERKPFLFTIPEDDEIGFAVFDSIVENCFVGAMDNPIYDNEVTPTKKTEQEKLLNAPIATVEAFDSDLDLEEVEESNKCEIEKCEGEFTDNEKTLEVTVTNDDDVTEINRMDGVTNQEDDKNKNNGVTENGSSANVERSIEADCDLDEIEQSSNSEIEKHDVEIAKDEEILKDRTDNSVTEMNRIEGLRNLAEDKNKDSEEFPAKVSNKNGVVENSGKSGSASVEAKDGTRSVKIVKNIKIFVRKEVTVAKDGDIIEDLKSPEQLNEDVAMKEVGEEIILACRETNTHHPYDVVKSEICPIHQLMKCMAYEEENCNYTEIDAKNMEVVTKTEQHLPGEPEPKAMSYMGVDRQGSARKDKVIIDAKAQVETVDETTEPQLLPMEVQGSVGDITHAPAASNQVNKIVEPDLKVMIENSETHLSPVNVDALEGDITQCFTQTPNAVEIHDLTAEEDTQKSISPERVNTRLPNSDTEKRFLVLPNVKANPKRESNIGSEAIYPPNSPGKIKTFDSDFPQLSTQNPTHNDNVTVVVGTKANVIAKTVETEISHVKAQESANTGDATSLTGEINKAKTFAVKEKTSKAAVDPNTSNKNVTVHTPIQSQESSSVKINLHGKRPQIGNRENKQIRSSRVSPTALEEEPRKVYLSSCNIRLTKSHEDLRFVERTPKRKQESIEEEEVPDAQSSQSEGSPTPTTPELNHLVSEDDAFKSVEPPSVHKAKITVQEVVGDRQRIVILNVKKKVHGKARWKSLNDLDSVKMALSPPWRSSDLGKGFAGVREEEERIEEIEMKDEKKAFIQIVPVVEVENRQDRKSLPEVKPAGQLFKSPVLNVTALQNCDSLTGSEVENKTTKASVMPVLQEEPLQRAQPVIEKEERGYSTSKLPIIKATALQYYETNTKSKEKPEIVEATVTPALEENPVESTKSEAETNETMKNKHEIRARVSRISLEEDNKTWIDNTFVAEENKENTKPPKRITRVHDISRAEVIPQLEKETLTEVTDESTKGNKIKIHVSHRVSPPDMKENIIQPHAAPLVKEALQRGREIGLVETSSTVEISRRQERESGYGSLGVSPSASINTQANHVFVLEGANERSVSSLSSIGDEEYLGEALGDSRIMVTDLDALLAQQVAQPPAQSPDIEKPEVKEKVRVLARMEPVPEKVIRINKEEDEDGLVIRHVKHEEPIVVQPIIIADTAEQGESQVISAFLVNDGYDDDELDEVFLEEYTPYHEPDRSFCRTHSSDADSETSSVNSLPLKHRHRQTRGALEAGKSGVRTFTESRGSSKRSTPVAELENENGRTSSTSNTPESNAHEISREESFSFHTPEQTRFTGVERPSEFISAFTPVSRTAEFRRPRARSYGHKSDEEPVVQSRRLGASFQDVETFPGLNVDKERFKETADSRKSMPDLSAGKEQTLNDSPYLRGLSAYTRKWLSQSVWMDPNGQHEDQDFMTSDMFLYPSNRFQPGSNIDASFLSLANERDFPDDISVSTLSTRPQSPMSEFSFAGETPFWGLRRDSATVIKCSNPRCEKEEVLFGGEKTTYTSCPACFTYYCARTCRRMHWSEHKKVCFFGRINSYIRSFIYLCHKKETLKLQLSQVAKDGYRKKGRGSVMVTFASAQLARKFMTTGCTFFPSPPTYSSLVNVRAEGVISKHKIALIQHIQDYQPEEEFVLNLAIIAGKMEDLPANPVPRRKVSTVLQVLKIPMSSKLKETSPASSLGPNDPNTETKVFYLPKCSRHEFVTDNEARRHYCRNISKNLKQYGIRLKHDYPDVYEKLCRYVDQNIQFTEPLTVYGNHGKKIVMCKIMPEAAANKETKA